MIHLAALVLAIFPALQDDATYVDRATGISVNIPSGWTVERPPEGEGVVKLYPSKGDDAKVTSCQLYVHEVMEDVLSGKMGTEDLLATLAKQYEKGFEEFEMLKGDGQRRGDHVVVWFSYKCRIGNAKLRAQEWLIFTKKRTYQILGMTTADLYDRHVGTFEKIAKSFTCEEAASSEKEDLSLNYSEILKQAKDATAKKNYDEAIDLGKKALRAKADNKWDAYYTIGYAYFYKYEYAEAAKYEVMSLEAAPENDTVLLDCLEALMCAGRGAETRALVEKYRDKKFVSTGRHQVLFAYLDLASFVVDGEYRRDAKAFEKKLNKFVSEMEDLSKAVDMWDTSGTEYFVEMHVRSEKSRKILGAVHNLLKWKTKPAKFRDAIDQIQGE